MPGSRRRGASWLPRSMTTTYGPAYLDEGVAAFRAGMGEVIGKMEVYVQLVLTGELLIIWPGACHHEQD